MKFCNNLFLWLGEEAPFSKLIANVTRLFLNQTLMTFTAFASSLFHKCQLIVYDTVNFHICKYEMKTVYGGGPLF